MQQIGWRNREEAGVFKLFFIFIREKKSAGEIPQKSETERASLSSEIVYFASNVAWTN